MAYIGDNAIELEPVETDNIGSLAALVLPELPQCNDLMVRQQLGWALREFCRETDACVIEQPCVAQMTPYGRCAFPITGVPHGMILGSVLDVSTHCGSIPFEVKDNPYPHVLGYIAEGDHAVLKYSVYPKAGGEDCPKWFKERYAEAIVAGAMHNLLSMQRAWADSQRAAEYGAKYTDAINEAAYRRLGSPADGGSESAIPCGGLFM
jgi:hypothetical protein